MKSFIAPYAPPPYAPKCVETRPALAKLVCLLAALAAPAGADARTAPTSTPPTLAYVVKPGDTLFLIRQAYLVGNNALAVVCRVNHITRPHRLRVGQVLHIPRDLLRDEGSYATVASFAGPVTLIRAGQHLAAYVGATIGESAEIDTGRNAFVTLRLADNTAMSLPSETRLRLTRLRRILLTGSVERNVELQNGRVRSSVTPMHDPNSSFQVTTPITVSAVRGTQFNVTYTAPDTATPDAATATAATTVMVGKVAVSHIAPNHHTAPDNTAGTLLESGFGLASTDGSDGPAVPLLAPPILFDPGKLQTGGTLHFMLHPLAGATAYRIQIAHDVGALDIIAEASSATPAFTLPSIPAGKYFLRVSALDNRGIEGMADTYDFERQHNEISASMSRNGAGRGHGHLFKWQAIGDGTPHYHFRLVRQPSGPSEEASPPVPPIIDETSLTGNTLEVTHLPPGDYMWQVSSILFSGGQAIEDWTAPQSFHIVTE